MPLDKFLIVQSFPNPNSQGTKICQDKKILNTTSWDPIMVVIFGRKSMKKRSRGGHYFWREMIRNNYDIAVFFNGTPKIWVTFFHFFTIFSSVKKSQASR